MQEQMFLLMIANLYFAVAWTPAIVIGITIVRGILLLRGRKREFEDWTRNPLMTALSIIFLPGTLVYFGIRYVLSKLARIRIGHVRGSATYGEVNLFLEVEKPPRVGVVLATLYASIVLTLFIALTLLTLPAMFILEPVWVLIAWYVSVGVFFNSSLRSGDLSLFVSSLRDHPRSGVIELFVFLVILMVIYSQVWSVVI